MLSDPNVGCILDHNNRSLGLCNNADWGEGVARELGDVLDAVLGVALGARICLSTHTARAGDVERFGTSAAWNVPLCGCTCL